jgi:ankyrin repeat protein
MASTLTAIASAQKECATSERTLEACSGRGTTPLIAAVLANDMTRVKALLEAGENVNAVDMYGFTALHAAIPEVCPLTGIKSRPANEAMLTTLLAAGADTNAKAHVGCTPLDCALEVNDATAVRILRSVCNV